MKKTVYIHIGTHKTGTTALQKFLSENSDKLSEKSYYYPSTGWYHFSQHKLAFTLQKVPHDAESFTKLWGSLQDEIDKTKHQNIIISSEEFSNVSYDLVEKIKPFLSNYDVKVIIYLRRQSDMFESMYNQQVKDWKSPRKQPINSFLGQEEKVCKYLNYSSLIDAWKNVFGKENIIIKIYEKDKMVNRNTVSDFMSIINVDIDYKVEKVNSSVSLQTIEIIRLYKQIGENKEIGEYLYKLCNKHFPPNKNNTSLLSLENRKKIDSKYTTCNTYLKEQYFFNNDNNLFSDEYSSDNNKEIVKKIDILKILIEVIKKYENFN